MGVGFCPEPREAQYHALDYKNTEAIQGLLRFYHQLKQEVVFKSNYELVAILADISDAIENCNLTDRQRQVIVKYMEGWTLEEIGDMLGISQPVVTQHLGAGCTKISNYLTKDGKFAKRGSKYGN